MHRDSTPGETTGSPGSDPGGRCLRAAVFLARRFVCHLPQSDDRRLHILSSPGAMKTIPRNKPAGTPRHGCYARPLHRDRETQRWRAPPPSGPLSSLPSSFLLSLHRSRGSTPKLADAARIRELREFARRIDARREIPSSFPSPSPPRPLAPVGHDR